MLERGKNERGVIEMVDTSSIWTGTHLCGERCAERCFAYEAHITTYHYCPGPLAQTEGKISERPLRKQSGSRNQTLPTFRYLM